MLSSLWVAPWRDLNGDSRLDRNLIENEKFAVILPDDIIRSKKPVIKQMIDLEKNFDSFLKWILDLRKNLNIPNKLSDVMDCSDLDLDKLSLMAFEDPSTTGNPKKISKEDLKLMYQHSISGELFK